MIKLKKLIKEVMDAISPRSPIAANIQQSHNNNFLTPSFINYIKFVENGIKKGYNSNKKMWFPHKSIEGGMPTIGYGHKIQTNTELETYNKGITDSQVDKLLADDLTVANKRVHDYIKRKYNVTLMLNQRQNEMLTDFTFNLGGLDKFPKFTDAVLRNQWDIVKKEYIRHSSGKELKGRNEAFYNRFLKNTIKENIIKESDHRIDRGNAKQPFILGIINKNGSVVGSETADKHETLFNWGIMVYGFSYEDKRWRMDKDDNIVRWWGWGIPTQEEKDYVTDFLKTYYKILVRKHELYSMLTEKKSH